MPRLIIKDSRGEQLFDMFEEELSIGRAPENGLVIRDGELSRKHCLLFKEAGAFWLRDLNSSNGTRLNGKAIDKTRLHEGDAIGLGKSEIVFQLLPGETDASDEAAPASEEKPKLGEDKEVGPADKPSAEDTTTVGAKARPARFSLYVCYADGTKTQVDFQDKELSIGRSSQQNVHLKDEAASHLHARLVPEKGGYRLIDEGSKNGTFIDGIRIKEKSLISGDVIHIGKTELRFVDHGSATTEIRKRKVEGQGVRAQAEEEQIAAASHKMETTSDAAESPAHEAESEEIATSIQDRAGDPDIHSVPVRSGDTRRLPVADRVEAWRAGHGNGSKDRRPAVDHAADASDTAIEKEAVDEEDEPSVTDEGKGTTSRTTKPIEGMGVARGHRIELVEEEIDTSELERVEDEGQEEDEDIEREEAKGDETTEEVSPRKEQKPQKKKKKSKKRKEIAAEAPAAEEVEEEETSDSLKPVKKDEERKPSQLRPPVHRPARHGHPQPEQQTSAVGTIIAALLSVVILGGAVWFAFREQITAMLVKQEQNPGAAATSQSDSTPEPKKGTGPSKGTALGSPAKTQAVGKEEIPLPGLPDVPSEPREDSTDATSSNGEMPEEPGEDDSVPRSRPLNATRRAGNYDFLKDLAVELAAMGAEEDDGLSDKDRRRLGHAQEMIRDFKLQEAAREIQAVEKQSAVSRNLSHQLKWITEAFRRMEDFFERPNSEIPLKEIVRDVRSDGRIVRTTALGVQVRENAGERLIRWVTLKPAEKYALARRCSDANNAGHHVGLGVLCINLDLPDEAKAELDQAEKLGFKNVVKYRELLRRRPDFLR